MDKIKFDFKRIMDEKILSNLKHNSPQAHALLKIFQKHGVDVMTATAILFELATELAEHGNECS